MKEMDKFLEERRLDRKAGSEGARELGSKGAREQGSKGAGSKGAKEQGSEGAREWGSKGVGEQGRGGAREWGARGEGSETQAPYPNAGPSTSLAGGGQASLRITALTRSANVWNGVPSYLWDGSCARWPYRRTWPHRPRQAGPRWNRALRGRTQS